MGVPHATDSDYTYANHFYSPNTCGKGFQLQTFVEEICNFDVVLVSSGLPDPPPTEVRAYKALPQEVLNPSSPDATDSDYTYANHFSFSFVNSCQFSVVSSGVQMVRHNQLRNFRLANSLLTENRKLKTEDYFRISHFTIEIAMTIPKTKSIHLMCDDAVSPR